MFNKLLTTLLSFFLWNNSIWALTPNADRISSSDVEAIVKNINKMNYTLHDVINQIASFDSKKSNEFKNYLAENPDYKKMVIPKVIQEDDRFSVNIDNKKLHFTLFTNGKLTLSNGDHSVDLTYSMTLKEMEQKLNDKIFTQNHSGLIDLFISKAYAYSIMYVIMAIGSAYLLFLGYNERQISIFVKNHSDMCESIRKEDDLKHNIDKLTDVYNLMTDKYIELCTSRTPFQRRDFQKETCEKTIPAIKKCFKEKIEQIKHSSVDDTSRSNVKNFKYEATTDKYTPSTVSK